jgi:putative SOS response-associated peptidase YedK
MERFIPKAGLELIGHRGVNPVVLGPETWSAWLGEEPADASRLKAMLAPYPSEGMTCWPESTRVGNVKNNDPSLIEPISAQ